MPKSLRIVRIVLCSPGDVQAEREKVAAIVQETDRLLAHHLGVALELWRWETDAHPAFHIDGPQGAIDALMEIEDADLVVGVFWRRFGTPTIDSPSGTVHELRKAVDAWANFESPQIMTYFNQASYTPKSKEETDQWGAVLDFKKRFPSQGLWWEYHGVEEFENTFREHLNRFLLNRFRNTGSSSTHGARFNSPVFRDSIMRRELVSQIESAVSVNPVVVLAGLSGAGKTYAASMFLSSVRCFRQVYWHDPDPGETLDSLLLALACHCEIEAPSAVARCKELLAAIGRRSSLLVIDNYHTVDQNTYSMMLDLALKAGPPVRVLLLSQKCVEPDTIAEPLKHVWIGGFSAQETKEYLDMHDVAELPAELIDSLVEKTDGLPFAIGLFCVLISRYGRTPRELLGGSLTRDERIKKWFNNIVSTVGDDAFVLLKSLSVCATPFNMGVVNLLGRRVGASNATILFGRLQRNLLVQRYLSAWWRIHELVASMSKSEMESADREEVHALLGEHYLRRIDGGPRARIHVDEWQVRACREFLGAGAQAKRGKDLLMSLAAPAKASGQYDLFTELSSGLIGRQAGEYLWIDYHHAHCAYILGAEAGCLRAVQALLKKGPEFSLRLAAIRLEAEAAASLGDTEAAIAILSEAIEAFSADSSGARTVYAHAKSVLAGLLTKQGDLARASRLVDELIEEAQRAEDLRGGAVALTRRAMILMAQGRLADARPLLSTTGHLFDECGDMRARAWSFMLQAELEIIGGDAGAGIEPLRQAEVIASAIGQAGAEYREQLRRVLAHTDNDTVTEIVNREFSRVARARDRARRRLTKVCT